MCVIPSCLGISDNGKIDRLPPLELPDKHTQLPAILIGGV